VFKINTLFASFTTLHSFTGSDGAYPNSGLTLSGSVLYGTTSYGGSNYDGTVFKVNTDGTSYTVLKDFAYSDGSPSGTLTLSGSALYGTTAYGGNSSLGTVFQVNTDGTDYTVLKHFASDGSYPYAGLTLSGTVLYGTTGGGGSGGNGTVFAVNTDGTGFLNLHNFTASAYPYYTNSDGVAPEAKLILSGNTLYGTAAYGGSSGNGTLFAIKTNGTGFTTLYSFQALDTNTFANSDGSSPRGVVLSGNTLCGTAAYGGSSGDGTVFASIPMARDLRPCIALLASPTEVFRLPG